MGNFKKWLEEADIPLQNEKGEWYDAETGFLFKDTVTSYAERSVIKNLEDRKFAKQFGGKALKGTLKQKEWAEKIRADKLKELDSVENAEYLCDAVYNGDLGDAKFWINNRDKKGIEIVNFFKQARAQIKVINAYNSKMKEVDDENYKKYYEAKEVYENMKKGWF